MTSARSLGVLVALAAAACVPPRPPAWVPTTPTYVAATDGFEVAPPPGWMRGSAPGESLVMTRDGAVLQRIVVASSEMGKPVGLGTGKRVARADMSPQELAELVVDDMRATESLTEVRVLENAPASVAGRSGFRVLAEFLDGRGLRRRIEVYGVATDARLYRLFYMAPVRLYFARDLPVFEELVRSFRLRPPAPAGR